MMINTAGLEVGYGKVSVLKDVNLEITRGTVIPFVGQNGAGKTTLFRTLLGLLKPLGGKLETDFAKIPPGYVPQFRVVDSFYPISTRQIVQMGLYSKLGFWKRPSAEDLERIDNLLERLQLARHADKRFAELSGGMKQKTFIARALAGEPEVLLLDEPTSELDAHSHDEILKFLEKEVLTRQLTVLFAVHGLRVFDYPWKQICLVHDGSAELLVRERFIEQHGSNWGIKP